jgi:hypothetical protein
LLLVGLALGLRIWVVSVFLAESVGPLECAPGRIAENLVAGRGFSLEFLASEDPTSHQAPFYPLLLAAAWWCFGVATPQAILAVQLLQCVAGTGLVLAVAWLGWSLVPERPSVGWVAAVGAAVYPAHVRMAADLQVGLWAAVVLTLLVAVVVSPRWQATRGGAILAGCLAGLLLLVEPILVLALPICAVAFWMAEGAGGWKDRFCRAAVVRLVLMAGVAVAIIAPWTVRNWIVHGSLVPIKSTFGYAFWQGNKPISSYDGLPNPSGYGEFADLSESEQSALLGWRTWQFVQANPAEYGRLCLRRMRAFLLSDETTPKEMNRFYRFATITCLVLAVIGLGISRDHWRRLWPTCAIFVAVGLLHTLLMASGLSRIPVESMTFVWGALAVAPLWLRLLPGRRVTIYRPGEQRQDPFDSEYVFQGPHYDVPLRRRAG